MSKPQVDLTLLKRLVAELESTLNTVFSIKADVKGDLVELNVEASKAVGLASGIMQESGLLIVDIHNLLDGQVPKSKSDMLEKLLGTLKGPGSSN
jgi:hypothetical protein